MKNEKSTPSNENPTEGKERVNKSNSSNKGSSKMKNEKKDSRGKDAKVDAKKSADAKTGTGAFGISSQLLKDAATWYFSTPIGVLSNITGNVDVSQLNTSIAFGDQDLKSYTPSYVCTLNFLTTPGVSIDGTSAVSTSMRNIFAQMCMKNSRTPAYGAADVMMYIIAVNNLYLWHRIGVRLYGCLAAASALNRYLPNALVEAMGFSYADFKDKMAEFREVLNKYAIYINSFAVPENFTLFDYALDLCTNLYSEGDSIKSQIYCFRPEIVYRWAEAESNTPNYLDAENYVEKSMTFSQYVSILDKLYKSLIDSESCAIINSDMMRTYESSFGKEPQIGEDFLTIPVAGRYDILAAINNATVLGVNTHAQVAEALSTFDITQSGTSNVLKFNPTMVVADSTVPVGDPLIMTKQILNARVDSPTPNDVAIMTSLMCSVTPQAEKNRYNIYECGSLIVLSAYMSKITSDPTDTNIERVNIPSYYQINTDWDADGTAAAELSSILEAMSMLSQFDWHYPVSFHIYNTQDGSGKPWIYGHEMRDIDVYTTVDRDDLKRVHDIMLMAQFGITG